MATEKFFVFNEDGALKRLKGRIVRFLDNEDPTGSDKDAIRTSLEVSPDAAGLVQADVGTAPNEIPVNGMLGDMAYQSSDGVSAAKLEVETLEVTGTVPDSLTIEHDTNPTLYLKRAGTPNGYIKSVDANGTETSGIQLYGSEVRLRTGASTRWTIDASGNLVAAAASDIVMPDNAVAALEIKEGGNVYFRFVTTNGAEKIEAYKPITASSGIVMGGSSGIDFGSAATSAGQGTGTTGTPANSVLSDYEYGSWEPTFKTNGTNFATMTMDVVSASYVKFGRQVICQAMIRTSNVDTTGATGVVVVDGLPFVSDSATDSHGTCTVGQAGSWVNMPEVGFTETNTAQVKLMKAGGAGFNSHLVPADFTTGATPYQNQMMFTVSYIAST